MTNQFILVRPKMRSATIRLHPLNPNRAIPRNSTRFSAEVSPVAIHGSPSHRPSVILSFSRSSAELLNQNSVASFLHEKRSAPLMFALRTTYYPPAVFTGFVGCVPLPSLIFGCLSFVVSRRASRDYSTTTNVDSFYKVKRRRQLRLHLDNYRD